MHILLEPAILQICRISALYAHVQMQPCSWVAAVIWPSGHAILSCAERELVLIKLRVPPGPARAEVMQLVDIFRARVVDVSEKTITLAVTGDAGKVIRFGIRNLMFICYAVL